MSEELVPKLIFLLLGLTDILTYIKRDILVTMINWRPKLADNLGLQIYPLISMEKKKKETRIKRYWQSILWWKFYLCNQAFLYFVLMFLWAFYASKWRFKSGWTWTPKSYVQLLDWSPSFLPHRYVTPNVNLFIFRWFYFLDELSPNSLYHKWSQKLLPKPNLSHLIFDIRGGASFWLYSWFSILS